MSAPADDLHDLAGEYVLGTLSSARRGEVEQRVQREPALRDAVQFWEERLLPLTALVEAVEPSAQLWERVERGLDNAQAPSHGHAVEPAATTRARPAKDGAGSWWNSLPLWRGLAATGFAAALLLAVLPVLRPTPAIPPQFMVVLVAPDDKAPGYVVQVDAARNLRLTPLGQMNVAQQNSLQFWTKGNTWQAPVSLGLVAPGQPLTVPLDKLPPLEPGQLFEITLEPYGGSSTGRPTGPILFIGRAVRT